MATETWQLFIDESGNFDDPDDRVVVAGWLLCSNDGPELVGFLRDMLDRAFPLVPYPPHANRLRCVATRVAGMLMLMSKGVDVSGRRGVDVVRRGVAALEALDDDAAREVLDEARAGRSPSWRALRNASHALWHANRSVAQRLGELHWHDMEVLRATLGSAPEGASRGLLAVEGGEAGPGEDRYLVLLETLIERALMLLREVTVRRRVWAQVLGRSLDVVAGVTRREHLRRRHVDQAIERAQRFSHLATPPGGVPVVQVIATAPLGFDERTHPGTVIADILSNAGRYQLGHCSSLERLEEAMLRHVGVPLVSVCRSLSRQMPALAGSGGARRAIEQAFAGPEAATTLSGEGVVVEQANRWIEAAKEAR